MAKSINCDIFIIPNSVYTFRNEDANDGLFGSRVYNQFVACFDCTKEWTKEKFVQVWYVTPGKSDSNWFDHNVDGIEGLEHYAPITDRLPISLFEGKKEGDVVSTKVMFRKHHFWKNTDEPGVKKLPVTLRLNNLGYRYSDRGPFEKALNELNVCEGIYHKD
jgi:hypothetical protein